MAVESKASVKSRFETNDTPTGGDFGNLIDSYQDVFDVLQAIGTAAQSGKFGVIEIQSSAAVTALPVADGGRTLLAASADSSQAGIQVALAASEASARSAAGLDGTSEVLDAGDLKPYLQPSTDVILIPGGAWTPDKVVSPIKQEVSPGSASLTTPTFTVLRFSASAAERAWFHMIYPKSGTEGLVPWEIQLDVWTSASSNHAWEISVSDGIPSSANSSYAGLTFPTTTTVVASMSAGSDRVLTTIATCTSSVNERHGVVFRIVANTAGSSEVNKYLMSAYVRFPVSAHNED